MIFDATRIFFAGAAIFIGSFLLFLIQPLVGNALLPAFGGNASIWTTCLVAFQTLLVVGYGYAHWLARQSDGFLSKHHAAGWFGIMHILFLLMSAGVIWQSSAKSGIIASSCAETLPPALGTLVAVVVLVGMAYILLSANASIVQSLAGGRYWLYAVGNAGSLCGLLAYPFVLEPHFHLCTQWRIISIGILVYAFMICVLMIWKRKGLDLKTGCADSELGRLNWSVERWKFSGLLIWGGLGALSCFLLNAVTMHLSCDIAPLPLIWTIVLSVYLFSWIFSFTSLGTRLLPLMGLFSVLVCIAALWHMGIKGYAAWGMEFVLGLSVIFLGGCTVHGLLYALRPNANRLTSYYFSISFGGAIGGLFAALLLPYVFDFIVEYPLSLATIAGIGAWCISIWVVQKFHIKDWTRITRGILIASVILAGWGIIRASSEKGTLLTAERNFYGIVRVVRKFISTTDGGGYWANVLRNGGTEHGFQLAEGNWKSRIPTLYYGPHAGGLIFEKHPARAEKRPIRAACCGLGVGALSAYSKEGDFFRFYEINPAVAQIASDTNLFTFVSGADGKIDIIVDDARKALEHERDANEEKYDIMSIDVFSGDAVPPHMLTREAFEVYMDRLAPNGILAIHVSNWHLDLQPVIKAAAREFKLKIAGFHCMGDAKTYQSSWVFLSRTTMPDIYESDWHIKIDYSNVSDVRMPEDSFHPLTQFLDLKFF